jgi:hypothetical protein
VLVLGLPGCSSFAIPSGTLIDALTIEQLRSTAIGRTLQNMGYTPLASWSENDTVIGYTYVACGDEANLSACNDTARETASMALPNFYVNPEGKVIGLEGPVATNSRWNYYMLVPESYQDFANLSPRKQQELLSALTQVCTHIGDPDGSRDGETAILTSIGAVTGGATNNFQPFEA